MSKSPQEEVHCSMTSEERKSKYRDLLDQVETLQDNEDAAYNKTDLLREVIGNADVLFKDSNINERIKHTDEVLLDAKVVAIASDVLLHITESIDCAIDTYDHLDLARKINSHLLNFDDTDYKKLANIANEIIKPAPSFTFLYGETGQLNVEEKPVKVRKTKTQKERQENVIKKVPEKVVEIGKEEESVDDTVKFLQWALNKECEDTGNKHLNYFNFIIDPNSFSSTIENMFHFSFLVRDGRVKMETGMYKFATLNCKRNINVKYSPNVKMLSGIIFIDTDGVIQITPVSTNDSKRIKKNGILYKQSIISININEWQELIRVYSIKKCFLSKWKSKWESKKNKEHM